MSPYTPREKNVLRSRIDQDSDISQLLTLWDQKRFQVLRGNLMIVPLFFEAKAYLLYVEPVYLQAERVKMSELKKRQLFTPGFGIECYLHVPLTVEILDRRLPDPLLCESIDHVSVRHN